MGGLEPRYSANILIDESESAFEVINQICAIFNGNPFWSNGSLDFYSDQPLKPMAFFNNGNVFDWQFTYQDVSNASNFNFQYTTMLGDIGYHTYNLGKNQEGTMLFFPAKLINTVYPFYNCDEERISISGNICFDMSENSMRQ